MRDPADRLDWLIYGAYGFTGRLIARLARDRGLSPILGGRDPARTRALATELDLPSRVFDLDDATGLRTSLADVAVVVHAAGPFTRTWRAMVNACLESRCHYLDITGEIEALEGVFAQDEAARSAGVVLVPGAGFDVVPTDSAAVRVASAVADPTHLDLAFVATGRPSSGSLRGIVEGLSRPGAVRRDGHIVPVAQGSIRRTIPYSDREREGVAVPWGDVSSAWYSTGVPNIRVFTRVTSGQLRWLQTGRRLLGIPGVGAGVDRLLHRLGGGPDQRELDEGMARIWAEARNDRGESATAELTVPNGYTFTADSVVEAVRRLLSGPAPVPGAQTPTMAFGTEFVDRLDGVEWIRG
jgi:saccharopine dehydrogenase (NAD+, L-lysine-forming)